MVFIKRIFTNKTTRIWFIVTAVAAAFMITVNILAVSFASLINQPLGGPRPIVEERTLEMTKDQARVAGQELGEKIVEEGIVMLKNADNTLPLKADEKKVSVFGKNSVSLSYGGSGSGGKSMKDAKNIFDSLTGAGFTYNPTLKAFYENNSQSGTGRSGNPSMESGGTSYLNTGETPQASYTQTVKDSYAEYKHAALVVLTRIGGEGWDLPRAGGHNSSNAQNPDDHYLQLDKHEIDLLKAVCNAGFPKVIVILNSNNPMELGFLDDSANDGYDSRINACLWIGTTGDTGIMALGKILNGDVSPSGKTVDTYSRNYKNDPVWINFGDMNKTEGQRYLSAQNNPVGNLYNYVDYQEDIYVGYRYFETRGFKEAEAGDTQWYNKNVVFPFGYGLSYAGFNQEFSQKPSNLNLTGGNKITVKVKVTNTSTTYAKSAKDVVQIYVTPPYTTGGIEKSHVVLAAFAKTQDIKPGAANAEEAVIEIDPYLFASYDEKTDGGCFILEGGSYEFRLGKSAHDFYDDKFTVTVPAAGIKFKNSVNGEVKNRFTDASDSAQLRKKLSRANFAGTMPEARTNEQRRLSSDLKAKIDDKTPNNPIFNSPPEYPKINVAANLKLEDMLDVSYKDSKWDTFIKMLTVSEMTKLVTDGAFKTDSIVRGGNVIVPETICADGPYGFVNFMGSNAFDGCAYYPSEVVLASTWNSDIAKKFGETVGDEALVGNKVPYSGWYAPGVNIHRSPFGGRAGEYYSEDPLLSGKMAAAVIAGAREKGVMTFVKHFAVNEQETNRKGIATWLSEQALREIYLRPFELAVTEGKTLAMMSSFNRIGARWTGGDYRLLTEVLRGEWGFEGIVVCDFFDDMLVMNPKQMIYAGGDLHLVGGTPPTQNWFKPSISDSADITILQQSSKNILFAVANSNITGVTIVGYRMAIWRILLIVFTVAVAAGLGVWGFFAIRKVIKKEKTAQKNV